MSSTRPAIQFQPSASPPGEGVPLDFLERSGARFLLLEGPAAAVHLASSGLRDAAGELAPAPGTPLAEFLRRVLGGCPDHGLAGRVEDLLAAGEPGELGEALLDLPGRPASAHELHFQPLGASGRGLLLFQPAADASAERREFAQILNSMPDGVFIIGRDKRVRFFNEACGRITGRSPEEIISHGCACNDVIHCHTEEGLSYAHSLCPARSVFQGEATHQREEMLLTNAAGEERWVETSYSPVRGPAGEVEYVIGVLRDVHDRKVLEERLHQTEKLASLGQLIAGIAHEIKNPLGIIMSSLDVLENRKRPAAQRKEAGQFIREEIRRLDDRLRSFLAFARPRDMQPGPVLVSGLLRRRAEAMAPLFPHLDVEVDIGQPEPILFADEEQLNQVLTNLILNAGEAMEGQAGRVRLRARLKGDTVLLEVEDEGPGIAEEFHSRVFDPFFTTKPDGTGLGLSICYQIVLGHGGTISIGRGRSGGGTCFTIRLPVTRRFEDRPAE